MEWLNCHHLLYSHFDQDFEVAGGDGCPDASLDHEKRLLVVLDLIDVVLAVFPTNREHQLAVTRHLIKDFLEPRHQRVFHGRMVGNSQGRRVDNGVWIWVEIKDRRLHLRTILVPTAIWMVSRKFSVVNLV